MVELVDDVGLGPAPEPREGGEAARVEPLSRKHDEPVVVQRGFEAREIGRIRDTRKVDALDPCPEDFGERLDRQRPCAHNPAARNPPSTRIVSPVTNDAAGEAR